MRGFKLGSSARRFLARGALFALLLLIPLFAPLLFSTGQFSLNAAGALTYNREHKGGPFYPNMNIEKVEQGDLGYGTKYALKKKVVWKTDEYGYRNTPSPSGTTEYDVVIIGDSFLVGYKLNQDETLSEVLSRKTKLNAYAIAPISNITSYTSDYRFQQHKPKVVILEMVERNMRGAKKLNASELGMNAGTITDGFSARSGVMEKANILIDRMMKFSVFQYYHAMGLKSLFSRNLPKGSNGDEAFRLGILIDPTQRNFNLLVNNKTRMMFMMDSILMWEKDAKGASENMSYNVMLYDEFFRSQGIKFMFLPVPDKENVYYDYMKSDMYFGKTPISIKYPKPEFLENITTTLTTNNVTVIDVNSAFAKARKTSNITLYQLDDTHWNEYGVNITADLIAAELNASGIVS